MKKAGALPIGDGSTEAIDGVGAVSRTRRVAAGWHPRHAATWRAVAPAGLLCVPVLVIAACFWPGHMNADTLTQLSQLDTGDFDNRHVPILLALWKPFWDLGAGPGWLLTAQTLVFVLGCYLVLRAAFRPLSAAAVTTAISLSPPVFGMLGLLGRDVWFIGLLLLTFGLLVLGSKARSPARWVCLGLALATAWLTLASRQNAAPAVLLACIAIAAMALEWRRAAGPTRASPPAGRRRVLLATTAGFLVTGALMATQVAGVALLHPLDASPEQYLYVYDLSAISVRANENLFPADVMARRDMEVIRTHHNVDSMLAYAVAADAPVPPLPPGKAASLGRSWRSAIWEHPLAYLDGRWDLFWRQVALTRDADQLYHPVIDGNPWKYGIRFPELNDVAKRYVELFRTGSAYDGGILFNVWAYLLVAAFAAWVLVRRRRPWMLRCVGLLALAALTYQSGIALGAMGTGYRLEFPAVVIGIVAFAVLVRVTFSQRSAPIESA